MPKVSVIVPTYNREKFINIAIESILRQSFKDFEIILVDDGSTDNTRKAIEPFINNIKYIYQKNSGVSAARNTGVQCSTGEWVAFLDSDDEWMKDYLHWQMTRIAHYPNMVSHVTNSVTIRPNHTDENHFRGTGLLKEFEKRQCLLLDRPLWTIIKYSPWFVQAAIMRRDVLIDAGLFDPALKIGEDLDLFARMALKGPFSICNKILVCIHRRAESIDNLSKITSTDRMYSSESLTQIYSRLRKLGWLAPREKNVLDAALSSSLRAAGNLLLKSGEKKQARRYFRKALLICPSVKSFLKYINCFIPAEITVRLINRGKKYDSSLF